MRPLTHTHERTLHLFTRYKHNPLNMIFSLRSCQILRQHTQKRRINGQFPKQQVWGSECEKEKKTGSAPLKTTLSPRSKGRKFTAPIKIKRKPSLERIYGVRQPQTTATLQLSQTHGPELQSPAHSTSTPLLTGWSAQLRLSIAVKRFDRRGHWKWKEGEFVLLFCV